MSPEITKIQELRIVPVVAIEDAGDANALADSLISGGLPCAEITYRTRAAQAAIEAMAKRGDILVGAGTVLTIDQVKSAVDGGARFIVSPGFNPRVVEYCVSHQIAITPGISNPTDIEMALEFDLKVLKFFPAEAFGGLKTLKALSAPYPMVRFIPTGGVNINNLLDYLNFIKVFACGGSWMVKSDLIKSGQFGQIEQLTRQAVALAASVLN